MSELERRFRVYTEAQLPRVLTQMDRDPDSPTFGCFDRDHWHYKMRDFASAILQQGVHSVEAIRKGTVGSELLRRAGEQVAPRSLEPWSVAAVNALGKLVDRRGRVNEYYPFEGSYPASAFGLYAVARVLFDWQQEAPHLLPLIDPIPLQRLVAHLSRRRETQAYNQQAAGLAALALAQQVKILAPAVSSKALESSASLFFSAQHEEGWFPEYGGPDFGYLTVTLDALADYFDASGDERAKHATERAVQFLVRVLGADGKLPSTLNSRNTDYVVPYGLARAAENLPMASHLIEELFRDVNEPGHFLWATDDRYHCHYIYASCVRALPWLSRRSTAETPADRPATDWLPGCGYWIVRPNHRSDSKTIYVGAYKGGMTRIHYDDRAPLIEHGLRVRDSRSSSKLWTTNWWDPANRCDLEETSGKYQITVTGQLRAATPRRATPQAHIALRAAAFVLRERLIPWLKAALIFRDRKRGAGAGSSFVREVIIEADGTVEIKNEVEGDPLYLSAIPGPRQHLRHVASAESFHVEDLIINEESPEHH